MKYFLLVAFFFILEGSVCFFLFPVPVKAAEVVTFKQLSPEKTAKLKEEKEKKEKEALSAITPRFPWGFDLFTGYYRPRLKTLNDKLGNPQLGIVQDPNFIFPGNDKLTSQQKNIAAGDLNGDVEYGLELSYDLPPDNALFFQASLWHGQSIASDIIPIPIFARPTPPHIVSCISGPVTLDYRCANRDARYNLILEQFWLGWRYLFYQNPKHHSRVFADLGLLGVSLAFLTMDSDVRLASPNLNFASVSSTEAMGWGYSSRIGVKGEYFITKQFTFGGGIRYVIGDIRNLSVTRYFPAGFAQFISPQATVPNTNTAGFPPNPPQQGDAITYGIPVPNGVTNAQNVDVINNPQPLNIEVDGLSVDFYFRIYF